MPRARNEGTIYKKTVYRNGKEYVYWEAQVTVGYDPGTGKRIRKTFSGDTQKEVRSKMQAASVDLENRNYFEPSTAALSEWIELWLREYCDDIKYQTRRSYVIRCDKHIKPIIGNVRLSELSSPHIQHLYSELKSRGLSPSSVRSVGNTLAKCLNVASKVNYIRENPAKQAAMPRVEKPQIYPLTNDQIKDFLCAVSGSQYENLFKTILFTGLRRSEALGLTWDCVDLGAGIITVNKQLVYKAKKDGGLTLSPPKTGKPRYIRVPEYVVDTLRDQKAAQDKQREDAGGLWNCQANFVFTDCIGNPIPFTTLQQNYKKLVASIGLPDFRIHDLRHTYTVLSIQNGADIKTVQESLGHATAAFTLDVYGHATDSMRIVAAQKMQSFIDQITKPENAEPQKG